MIEEVAINADFNRNVTPFAKPFLFWLNEFFDVNLEEVKRLNGKKGKFNFVTFKSKISNETKLFPFSTFSLLAFLYTFAPVISVALTAKRNVKPSHSVSII